MDRPTLYIETSIVSYLASRASRDPVTLRNQQLTHAWWNTRRHDFALYTSQLVVNEAADGDPVLAARRIALLKPLTRLELEGTGAAELARELRAHVPLPPQGYTDALHIALSAVSGMAYLLTWNCKHIANPRLHVRIRRVCEASGFTMPILCTPVT